MASLGEMASGIAHEINNPLAIITAKTAHLMKVLEAGTVDPLSARKDLVRIQQTAYRIASIVKGLRAFSRSADRDPFAAVSLDNLINDTLSLCHERFKNSGVELILRDIPNVSIDCRGSQISQVLLNLLNNAFDVVQALPAKWVSLSVAELPSEKIQFSVTDSGNGISPDIVEKLMQPFFTTKDVGKGTGLGLSIARGIIEDHGGQIYYDKTSANTRFVFELPIRQTNLNEKQSA